MLFVICINGISQACSQTSINFYPIAQYHCFSRSGFRFQTLELAVTPVGNLWLIDGKNLCFNIMDD